MADKVYTIVDITALQLKARAVEGSNRPAAMKISTWQNKVSISVFTGVDSLPNKGVIGINLHPYEFFSVLQHLEELTKLPYNEGERITRKMVVFNKAGKDKEPIGEVAVGRTKEGIYYICIISTNNSLPKISFKLTPPLNTLWEGDMTDEYKSRVHTLAFVNWWRLCMSKQLSDTYEKPDNSQYRNNYSGNKGGYNRNNNSSNNDDDYDDAY